MKKQSVIAALAVLVLALGAFFLVRSQREQGADADELVEQGASKLPFRVGDVHRYDLTLRTRVEAGGGTMIDYALTGVWRLDVLRANAKGVVLNGRIEDAELVPTGAALPPDSAARVAQARVEFAQPTRMMLNAEGGLVQVFGDERRELQVRSMLRAVAAVSQVSGEREGKQRWQREEWDNVGRYQVAYERQSADALMKVKQRYTVLDPQAQTLGQGGSGIDVRSASARLSLRDDGFLQKLEAEEVVAATGDTLGGMVTTTSYALRYRGSDHMDDQALAAALSVGVGAAMLPNQFSRQGTYSPETDSARIAGRTLPQVIEELSRVPHDRGKQSEEQATRYRHNFIALAALLRRDPGAADEVLARIEKDDGLSPTLWDALGSAGSPTAQAALVRTVQMPQWNADQRTHQMISLSMVDEPTQDTVDFLAEQARTGAQSYQARLGLGTAAFRLREGAPDRAKALVADMVSRLDAATDSVERRQYLAALGNTGHPDALAPILRFAGAEDRLDRSQAMTSLRYQRADSAVAALVRAMLSDPDSSVRAAAAGASAHPPAPAPLLDALRRSAQHDATDQVRQVASSSLNRLAQH